MTTPIDDEGVGVPLRLQPVVPRPQDWRGRPGNFIAVGLVAFVAVALVLGTALDDGRPSSTAPIAVASLPSSSPTARPSARPTATREPLATPLPAREVLGGQIPTERRLVYANGLELLDLATGELSQLGRQLDYTSLALPNDEIACACVVRDVSAGDGATKSFLRFGRYGQTGETIVERDLLSFEGVVAIPDMDEGFSVATALSPDGQTMYVLVAERHPPVWTIVLDVVDVETGDALANIDIDQVPIGFEEPGPSASPRLGGGTPDGVYLWATSVAVPPSGHSVFVSIDRSEVRGDNWTWQTLGWTVDTRLDNGAAAKPPIRADPLEVGGLCLNQPTFIDAALLVQVCGRPSGGSLGALYVRRLGSDGHSLPDLPITSTQVDGRYPITIVVDRSRRALFLWVRQRHAFVRVGVDDGQIQEAQVSASMLPDTTKASGSRGGGYAWGDPGVVVSPDGHRLYALGLAGAVGNALGVPSGVWVFDPDSLRLLDHWEPRAFLSSLAVSKDGRFVYAAGATGFDVDGRENPWPASITVYDAANGEIQVLYGAVTRDYLVGFVDVP